MKNILSIIFLFFVCAMGPQADPSEAVDRPGDPLSDEEMAQVVTAMLEATYAQSENFPVGGFVYVSERSLSDQWVINPIAGYTVRILTLKEIDERYEGDFTYLEFGRFSRTADGVKASVTTSWRDQDGKRQFCETTYWCKKFNDKWEFAGKEAWIGNSCGQRSN